MGCLFCCCRAPREQEEQPLIREAEDDERFWVPGQRRGVGNTGEREAEVYVDDDAAMEVAIRLTVISELPITRCTSGMLKSLSAEKRECLICMCEYAHGEELRFLPCMHIYHRECVDQWLMKALRCPECGERPLDDSGTVATGDSEACSA